MTPIAAAVARPELLAEIDRLRGEVGALQAEVAEQQGALREALDELDRLRECRRLLQGQYDAGGYITRAEVLDILTRTAAPKE